MSATVQRLVEQHTSEPEEEGSFGGAAVPGSVSIDVASCSVVAFAEPPTATEEMGRLRFPVGNGPQPSPANFWG